MMSSRSSFTSLLDAAARWKFTSRALPKTRLFEVPTNTSPFAPTYSGSADVAMLLVVVIWWLQVLALSMFVVTFTPTSKLNTDFASFSSATANPIEVVSVGPNFQCNIASVSDVVTEPLLFEYEEIEPEVHSALESEPGGSRRIISTISGPAVTKLLPVGIEPSTIHGMPLPLQL